MKEKTMDILKTIWDILKFIGVIAIICFVLKSCNEQKEVESPTLNICGSEIDMGDYYTNKIEWNHFEKDVNVICEEYYLNNE